MCLISPMDRQDVTDGVTCDQEAIKAHAIETAAASCRMTTQHRKDQALSDSACCTTSSPGPCHF